MNEEFSRNTDNKILIDWLSFTSKEHSVSSMIDMLGLTGCKFTETYGMQGFQNRLIYDGISIHFNSNRHEGVWVEMSGQGCRAFETNCEYEDGFLYLFEYFKEYPDEYHVTRLDVAYDDFQNVIPLNSFARDVLNKNYVSRFKDESMTVTCSAGRVGYTIDCGSRKSDIKFRIYDKAYERGYRGEDHFPWTRFEIQMRNDRALNFINMLDTENLGTLFSGVIVNYFRIVKPDKNDSNKRRWNMKKWFKDFIGDVEAISLFTKCETDYNLAKCEDFVYGHCGNSIDALIEIKGIDTVLKELKERKPERTPKYIQLINENSAKTTAESNSAEILQIIGVQ
ncbi:MAG: replication initiation factor domain-containing protein [Oscillospiraceae bacterium]|nr:replication initiation factor domain-containing protein [Oscillospiraceae bacterium]